ncbi:hypothetical protein T05_14822 [Trichinella murrelli]|uniref:Uncharacterized protein n=1 Tax=Trichinella murrelli TaxID=144512 RepID=A0A0V0UC93_9BILA|nr:hypothetical protein T05_14822 [Trichinella murrelli]
MKRHLPIFSNSTFLVISNHLIQNSFSIPFTSWFMESLASLSGHKWIVKTNHFLWKLYEFREEQHQQLLLSLAKFLEQSEEFELDPK